MTFKVLQVIPKLGFGGAETGCYDLAHYLSEKNCKSYIITSGGSLLKYVKKNKVRMFTHYTSTPYSMEQTLVMKYNSKMNVDIGQGLLHLIKDFKKNQSS